MIEHIFHY